MEEGKTRRRKSLRRKENCSGGTREKRCYLWPVGSWQLAVGM